MSEVAQTQSTGWLIEMTGIEIMPESERSAKPRDLFWPWFAPIVSVIGIVVSFLFCGLFATSGKRGSASMVLSRAAFGNTARRYPA